MWAWIRARIPRWLGGLAPPSLHPHNRLPQRHNNSSSNHRGGDARPHVLILGSGWAGMRVLAGLSHTMYRITMVSPRNYFVFTPLLPGTVAGTVESRSIVEPVRRFARGRDIHFLEAECTDVDPVAQTVLCRQDIEVSTKKDYRQVQIHFDKLIIAVGASVNTFGIKGVQEFAYFLKEVPDARRLRYKIFDCFEMASNPDLDPASRRELLHFIVVGGGPTGVETAAEISDLVAEDLQHLYPEIVQDCVISLFEAHAVLSSFDKKLQEYTRQVFERNNIDLRIGVSVKEVRPHEVVLQDDSVEKCGFVLWSTGIAPRPFIRQSNSLPVDMRGRITVDEFLQVTCLPDATNSLSPELVAAYRRGNIFALGDCSYVENRNFPATAAVAQQQAKYLARVFTDAAAGHKEDPGPFKFVKLGMLSYVGGYRAVADVPNTTGRGYFAWLFWRSVYLTKLVSLKNKVLVPLDWAKTFVFGRDVSKF